MNRKYLLKALTLLACLLCSLGAAAAEAYTCYTSSNTTLTFYYDNYRSSRSGLTYDLDSGSYYPGWINDVGSNVTRVVFDSSFSNARPTKTTRWFYYMNNLESVEGIKNCLNTSQVTNMDAMFYSCTKLTSLDVSGFNTANVTDMGLMFYQCLKLESLDLSSFNTAKVTSMGSMFAYCQKLTSLNLSNFNTAKVTSMSSMFNSCSILRTIVVGSGWNTSAVTTSGDMFFYCPKLVGEMGTTYDANHVDKAYAHIDGGTSNPGYLSSSMPVAQPYACYTSSNTTLTFYYDTERWTRTGTTYDLPTNVGGATNPGWYTDGTYSSVTRVVFDSSFASARPTSAYSWFRDMSNLTTISDISNLNTSEMRNMIYMFNGCSSLTSLDLSHFNTAKVTDMMYMFNGCSGLSSINLSSFNTANVNRTYNMFAGCTGLTSLDLSNFNTSSVTIMSAMFKNCSKLTSLDLSNFNTSNVTTMASMFQGCTGLTSLNVSSFNTANVTKMDMMFYNCRSLTSLDLSNFNTAKVTTMNNMFYNIRGLTSLDLRSFNTSQVTDMGSMFYNSTNLVKIYPGNGWNTDGVTSSSNMFGNCSSLMGSMGTTYDSNHKDKAYAHIDGGPSNPGYLSDPNVEAYACYTSSNTTLTFYYDNQRSNRTGRTYDLNEGETLPGWYPGASFTATRVVFDPSFANARPTTTFKWFVGMDEVENISGLNYLNTSQVTNMSQMFDRCSSLTSLDLSGFNTANVTNMSWMFYDCKALTSLNVSSFNTAKVTDMRDMFGNCNSLRSLDLSNFNTANVTDMCQMFAVCLGLTNLDVSNFNTAKVTDMLEMFVADSCLTSLDLSSFNTANVTEMRYMFQNCSNLRTIYVGDSWSTAAVIASDDMFIDCPSLVGGMGTTYDANHVDKAYAHIDGGTSNPGYFTAEGAQPWTEPEAYACYTPSNSTLTFYYDNQRASRTGITYSLNEGDHTTEWYDGGDGIYDEMTAVVFDPSFAGARPTTTYTWFYEMYNLRSITGLEYLNTSQVTNMRSMFDFCEKLTTLDLSSFNTANVTDMRSMFDDCYNLTTIYVGDGWSTAAVTSSNNMFKDCNSLVGGQGTTYDANHIDKAYARIDGGPSNPGYFTAQGAQPWNGPVAYACYTPSNTTLTFYYDNQRSTRTGTTYGLNADTNTPRWKSDGTSSSVSQVVFDPSFANARPVSTYYWFSGMQHLQSITGMKQYLNTENVTRMNGMFRNCSGITTLDLSSFNIANVVSMGYMFCNTGLTTLNLSSFNTANVGDMYGMFYQSSNLTTIYVGDGWNTDGVDETEDMFLDCTSLVGGMGTTYDSNHTDGTYAHIDGGTSNPGYFTAEGAQPWTEPEAYACYTPSNTTLTFYYDNQRSTRTGTTYDLDAGSDQPGWYTDGSYSSVTRAVFDPSFADARPTSTRNWFYNMRILESISGLGYLNTSEVTTMDYMFTFCSALTSLDVSNFNTANVTTMCSMFNGCIALTSLDVSNFNTANVTKMADLFESCKGLTTLDLGNWNTAKVTNPSWMFSNCTALKTIYVGNEWSTDAVTFSNGMFSDCTSLVGGAGTAYSASNPKDKTYAHIDGGPNNPGYFTDINAPAGPEAYACYAPSNTTLTFYYDNQRANRTGTTYDLNEGMNDPGWDTDNSYKSVTRVVFDPSFADARPTSMCSWFWGMTNLQSIDGMDCVNTEEVTTMWGMFTSCSGLTVLDLSGFNTSKVTNMLGMFGDCSNLTTIYAGEGWSMAAVSVSSNMFSNCTKLVGGKGTAYDPSHTNGYYARIDGGPSFPGYFTEKVDFVRGDVNGDNQVSIGDVTTLIDYLLSGDASGINLAAADCNQDEGVSIGDVTTLIDYLLSGSW